jgi:hypothetical protein
MRRRDFIALMGGGAIGWPLAAYAQQADRYYRIGFQNPSGRNAPPTLAFLYELRRVVVRRTLRVRDAFC